MRLRKVVLLAALVVAPFAVVHCASSASDPQGSSTDRASAGSAGSISRAVPSALREGVTFGDALPDEAKADLAISLLVQDQAGLAQLLADQQDPTSPRYHAWVTPEQFGAQFGVPQATYARITSWLATQGFAVTAYPNRLFVEAHGTVAGVRKLLSVQPRLATKGAQTFRSYAEPLSMPDDVEPFVAKIGGLDTRRHLHHRLPVTFQGNAINVLGAADLRALYDVSTTDTGASGLTLAILGTQEGTQPNQNATPAAPFIPPSAAAISEYFTTISNATVAYNPIVLPNAQNDLDSAGSNGEYELDVEMQSVGSPNAKDIDLVLSPASVVFQTGAQYIVNTLSGAVVVSTSLGDCESDEIAGDAGASTPGSDAYLMRMAVQQGVAEGQVWFAAAGDEGADDCEDKTSGTGNGFGGGNATVDFPCSVPEIVCMGGTQLPDGGTFNASGDITAYEQEIVWNEGTQGGAGGGGQSLLYAKPSWQSGVGPNATDGTRDVPDLALAAADGDPGVGVYDCSAVAQDSCGTGGADQIDVIGGTSVASPLAAGLFAHLAGQLGCRLGDVHPTIYTLGAAQQGGGAQPFHDITSGNNSIEDAKKKTITGFTAGPGYDLVSGWGSIDLAKLIAAWPPCTATLDGGGAGGGGSDGGGGSSDGGGGGVISGGGDDGGGGGESSGGSTGSGSSSGSGNGASGSGGGSSGASGSSGCGCTTAGGGSSGSVFVGIAALGVFGARRRRRGMAARRSGASS